MHDWLHKLVPGFRVKAYVLVLTLSSYIIHGVQALFSRLKYTDLVSTAHDQFRYRNKTVNRIISRYATDVPRLSDRVMKEHQYGQKEQIHRKRSIIIIICLAVM